MSMVESGVQSSLSIAVEILDAIKDFANTMIRAEEDRLISFDDQIVPTALEIMANIMQRASAMQPGELNAFLAHLREDGPVIAQQMIEETIRTQSPPIMHREYLAEKLIKPPSP